MKTSHELLAAAYAAFNAREIDTVLALLDPDVDWPNGLEGGRAYGREEVRDYWTRQWAEVNPRVEPVGMEDAEDGRTLVRVHQVVRDLAGNLLADQIVNHVYTIADGMIVRMEIESPEAEAA
jgi:hypothetical protein